MAAQYSIRSSAAQGSTTMTQGQRSAGSRTATVASVTTQIQPVLVLRPDNTAGENSQDDGQGQRRRGIRWAENVVDNEGLGRKKSKVCCIYHAPRPIDESSDESSSDSSSSDGSDSEPDNSSARPSKKAGHGRDHEHGKGCGDGRGKKPKPRQRSPNAYEKMPKAKDGGSGGGKERS